MRALVDVGRFIALANTLKKPKDRADFLDGFIAGIAGEAWNDGNPVFSEGQSLGITAIGSARANRVA